MVLSSVLAGVRRLVVERATGLARLELREHERLFAMLVLGPAVGMPTVPPAISLRLVHLLEPELVDVLRAAPMSGDQIARLAGHLDIG